MRKSALCIFAWFISGVFTTAGGRAQASDATLIEKENLVEIGLRGTPWKSANLGAQLNVADRLRTGELSRAAIRFTDLSVLRIDELTNLQIVPPANPSAQQELEVEHGGAYFFSRQKGNELQIRTPSANGALRGTEFAVRVGTGGHTTMTVYEGEVEMANPHGTLLLKSGEQGEAEIGKPPRKTAVIDARNIIQWCLYYPAVIDPGAFRLGAEEVGGFAESLAAYRQGDLLGALAKQLPLPRSASINARLYHAATVLAVGQVERAQAALAGVPTTEPGRLSIEQVIAAVKLKDWKRSAKPRTSSEWMAESYYKQSKGDLSAALQAARKATQLSPEFGFAWVRVAELLFSTGNTRESVRALDRGLQLAPKNAQAHALRGFILSAENRIDAAHRSFEEAISRDGALGNAWLGRGLTSIRQGRTEEGGRDLQTAATLEPNRSILRSYLGKGFSEVGNKAKAKSELDLAKKLDPNNPTPWLYSAIERSHSNEYNQAVDDLNKSLKLNENRRIYRSQFLLDQDRAVRSTNLALMYLNNGMKEQSVREAVRALNDGYASAGAHLFLSNSFTALRDPSRFMLRY
ncbi:MAG: FecR domain-containing protein, partial [Verrucomicrobiota bacterium]